MVDSPWGLGEARRGAGQYEASRHCPGWYWAPLTGTRDRRHLCNSNVISTLSPI